MEWIAQHLQLIIVLAGGVAWLLKKGKGQAAEDAEPSTRPEKTFDDPDLAERTRRIREEIQRKIEQRARGYANEQPTGPRREPVARPLVREAVSPVPPVPVLTKAAAARQDAQRTTEILEQQAALMEQLRMADEVKTALASRSQFETQVAGKAEAVAARSALADDLRNPATLRRALILREILGPPLALRP